MTLGPWVESENFNPGYIMRGIHLLPQCGDKIEWRHTHDYWEDKHTIPTPTWRTARSGSTRALLPSRLARE